MDIPEIGNVPILFGLRAQGHVPTIERMLAENKTWEEIGKEIGWCPKTAEQWWNDLMKEPNPEDRVDKFFHKSLVQAATELIDGADDHDQKLFHRGINGLRILLQKPVKE